jgi:hypothetical protein
LFGERIVPAQPPLDDNFVRLRKPSSPRQDWVFALSEAFEVELVA